MRSRWQKAVRNNHGEVQIRPHVPCERVHRRGLGACPTGRAPGPVSETRSSWRDMQDPSRPKSICTGISSCSVRKLKAPPGKQEADVFPTKSLQSRGVHRICASAEETRGMPSGGVVSRAGAHFRLFLLVSRLGLMPVSSYSVMGCCDVPEKQLQDLSTLSAGPRKDAGREWCSSGLGCRHMDRRCQLQATPWRPGKFWAEPHRSSSLTIDALCTR